MVGGEDVEPNLHTKIKLCKLPAAASGYIPTGLVNM
jgi:hypothetical protein